VDNAIPPQNKLSTALLVKWDGKSKGVDHAHRYPPTKAFPVGAKYVLEGCGGIVRRYIQLPNGRRIKLEPATAGREYAARIRGRDKTPTSARRVCGKLVEWFEVVFSLCKESASYRSICVAFWFCVSHTRAPGTWWDEPGLFLLSKASPDCNRKISMRFRTLAKPINVRFRG